MVSKSRTARPPSRCAQWYLSRMSGLIRRLSLLQTGRAAPSCLPEAALHCNFITFSGKCLDIWGQRDPNSIWRMFASSQGPSTVPRAGFTAEGEAAGASSRAPPSARCSWTRLARCGPGTWMTVDRAAACVSCRFAIDSSSRQPAYRIPAMRTASALFARAAADGAQRQRRAEARALRLLAPEWGGRALVGRSPTPTEQCHRLGIGMFARDRDSSRQTGAPNPEGHLRYHARDRHGKTCSSPGNHVPVPASPGSQVQVPASQLPAVLERPRWPLGAAAIDPGRLPGTDMTCVTGSGYELRVY
jgi:hypothetical protein